MKRLFIATKIELQKEYFELVEMMKQKTSFNTITWVKPEVQHLTFRFLGKTPPAKENEIIEMMRSVSLRNSQFNLEINRLGVFGSRYAPKVLWLGFAEQPPLYTLFEDLEKGLSELQFPANYGNFVPHLTLARIKQIENKKRFWQLIENVPTLPKQVIPINEITLYQSRLEKTGPIYTALETCPLQQ